LTGNRDVVVARKSIAARQVASFFMFLASDKDEEIHCPPGAWWIG